MYGTFIEQHKDVDEVKNSKILNRKQIEKRLQGLKTEQYVKISNNLKTQNEKLKSEVKILSQKVEQLVQARKMQKSSKNPQIEQQIVKHKKQLELKYESMTYLKEQVRKQNQVEGSEEVKHRNKQTFNLLHTVESQVRQQIYELQKAKKASQHYDESLKQYLPNNEIDERLEELKKQNKAFKLKVNKVNEELKAQEKDSQFTINKIYELKREQKKRVFHSSTKQIPSINDIKSSTLDDMTISSLEREVEELKRKKKQLQKDVGTEKSAKESKKSKMEKQIKESLEYHKELYKRRVKSLHQLNYYEQKQKQLREIHERSAILQNREFEDKNIQTAKVNSKEFRKEWIGRNDGFHFDDFSLMEDRENASIKAVTVFKTPEQIVFVRFHYETLQKKKYQSEVPFEKAVLKRCEAKKIESKTNAMLNGLVVSTANKKIVRIEFKWADGDSSVAGWESEGSTRFVFDIAGKERPICMFGTMSQQQSKQVYVLESLGCEIL